MKRTILGGLIVGLACSHAWAAELNSGIDQQVRAQDDFFPLFPG